MQLIAIMILGDQNMRNGARPVRIHQAGAAPGSVPRRSPPKLLGIPSSSCEARRRGGHATGHRPSKTKQTPSINIMHWNAEGVSNKKEELEHFLHTNNINVCCLQETHLQEGKSFKIRGYQVFRADGYGRKKGGVITLVRNNINANEMKRYMDEAEYLSVKITTKESSYIVTNYYCPEDKMLALDTIQVPDSGFLIVRDFNSRSQSWGYNNLNRRGEEVESWQDDNHLILVNDPTDTPTFYSRRWKTTTTPDLALCTDDIHQKVERTVAEQLGGSDHRPVILTIYGETPTENRPQPRWNYKKAKWSLFAIRTNELTEDLKVEGRNINNVVKDFNKNILQAAKDCIPRGARKDYLPYWSNELQQAHESVTKAREEVENNPTQENNIKLQESKAKYLRTKLQSKRNSWREKTAALNMEKDTTKLWMLTRALNDEGTKGQKISLEEEERTLTGKKAADAFAKHYAKESDVSIPKHLQKEARKEEKDRRNNNRQIREEMQHVITMSELVKAVKKLKKKKSPGPDNITNEMIQHLGNAANQKLLDIFNLSWNTGQVPQCWREATMITVLKKGKNKGKAQNYRPISLTSCVCKTMERIVNQRLQLYLETEGILVPEQAGFRQYRSTEDQTTHLSQIIEDAFQAKKVTLAVFIDLQKAFDKVWKDGLLVKLLRCGISGHMYQWTKSFLHNRRARVTVDGQCSRKALLRQGVPQGGVLSPTLFILFINDIVSELPMGVQAALYADDLVLWCTEEYATTANYRMQMALDQVSSWSNTWCVSINRDKTTGTLFSLSPKADPGRLTLGEVTIKMEDQQTYLGVTYDKKLTWRQHITMAECKARRKLNIMRKLAGTQWGANDKILKSVYQGTVRPHLEYGSNSWMTAAKTHQQTLDKVQNQALRIITGGMKSTPIGKMEQVSGIPPLSQRRKQKAMLQTIRYQCTQDHPMSTRLEKLSSGRLNRSSFVIEARTLRREHQERLPIVQPITFSFEDPPWEERTQKVSVNMTVPGLIKKDDQTDTVKRALTATMLEEQYPSEAWLHVYTDGSATDATKCGGAGVYIRYPSGQWQTEAAATGTFCTNYKAEVEALILAADTIRSKVDKNSQIVFLTDALSVLQAFNNSQIPQLERALHNTQCLRIVLQWVPSHCGIKGNEEADKLAKTGAQQKQPDKPVSFTESKTIIKAFFKAKKTADGLHRLTRQDQVIIFRLRTGHNRLNQHMYRKLKLAPTPMCFCGQAEQDTVHILQECRALQQLREEMWPSPATLEEKLYGQVEDLQTTATFLKRSGLSV